MELETTHPRDGVTVVRPVGRLDMIAAAGFRELLVESVRKGRATIVVDLAATEFIDSSGLGALIAGLKAARTAGGDLRIACPTAQVQMVLELTSLDRVLRPYTSVSECLT